SAAGAQTERRGEAWPERDLPGGETSPAVWFQESGRPQLLEGVAAPVGVRAFDVVRGVGAEDAVADGEHAAFVGHAAAVTGGVAGQGAVADGQRAEVNDAAAVIYARDNAVPGQGAAGHRERCA